MSRLPERIKKIRIDNNLSQEAFAKELGIHRGHVSKIETGAANPSESVLLSICMGFNVSWKWLNEGKGRIKGYWGSKEVTQLVDGGLTRAKQKSILNLLQMTIGALEAYNKIRKCFGDEILRVLDYTIKPGDPIITEILEEVLDNLRLNTPTEHSGALSISGLSDAEESVRRILRAIPDASLKDFYLFLASKAETLNKNQRQKLKKDIALLKRIARDYSANIRSSAL